MNKTFYSNGKLLLTGEYAVLDGATALAIPTSKGQSLKVTSNTTGVIDWNSLDDLGNIWFQCRFKYVNDAWELSELPHSPKDASVATTLLKILKTARTLNEDFLEAGVGYEITTRLDFPRDWGLGTSSTLINNIAQWAGIDAFELLEQSFGGSGYDIAAAQNDRPILYKKAYPPITREIRLPWEFKGKLFFVHLNQKQDSKEGIARYKEKGASKIQIQQISDISEKLLMCYELTDFQKLMEYHERLISEIIELPTVKQRLFSDFKGIVKSLGAWGGDFVLVSGADFEMEYFRKKGYHTIIPFEEMIKK